MAASEAHAPSLSTQQDESNFLYAKVKKAQISHRLDIPPGRLYLDVVRSYYSIEELVQFLAQTVPNSILKKYKTITLQFPDSLICDSAAITSELQACLGLNNYDESSGSSYYETNPRNYQCESKNACQSGSCKIETNSHTCGATNCCGSETQTQCQRLWILADTSYSSCCVDEVAADHVGADLMVHFGDACLNRVTSLPSAYVFGTPQIDQEALAEAFKERYPLSEYNDKTVVLMADAPHSYLLQPLKEQLLGYRIVVADLLAQENMHFIGYTPKKSYNALRSLSRIFLGLDNVQGDDSVLSECHLLHIATPEAPRLLQLTTKFSSVSVFTNGKISQGPFPNLMRRYRYMHMARAAGTVGILVNTLSLANTKALIHKIGERVKAAGKRHYVCVVGKPNVAKLANFDAVDIWCVLGCNHQGIILDEYNEYFKPIVTPYELLLAIGDEFLWTGKWVTEFEQVLRNIELEEQKCEPSKENGFSSLMEQESDEEPEFCSVTGKYVSSARPLRRLQHLQISHDGDDNKNDGNGALVEKLGGAMVLRGTVSTAAVHLQTREWKGLGSDWTENNSSEPILAEEGISGIARGYEFDTLDAARKRGR